MMMIMMLLLPQTQVQVFLVILFPLAFIHHREHKSVLYSRSRAITRHPIMIMATVTVTTIMPIIYVTEKAGYEVGRSQ